MTIVLIFFVFLLVGGAVYVAKSIRQVPHGMIGLQERRVSLRQPGGPGGTRVSVDGGPGPQADVLIGNRYYFRPSLLYKIKYVPQTHIEKGTIGLVVAKVGRVAPASMRLAPYVECDYFQDGAAFLRNEGYRGHQMQVLTSGYYDINPHIFDVITVENATGDPDPRDLRMTEIDVGETGVVITHVGEAGPPEGNGVAPRIPGHDRFHSPWAFIDKGGQLGVQAETLTAGGTYAINPWFAHVVKIPTRDLVLEWSKSAKKQSNYDVALGEIVLNVQGHTVRLDMKQTLSIPEEAAPGLVLRFGDRGRGDGIRTPVQQFVEKELATIVSAYFLRIAARAHILEFMTRYDELGMELSREVSDALAVRGIRAVTTALGEWECDQPEMDKLRRDIALERNRIVALQAQLESCQVESDIEQKKIEVEAARRKLNLIEIQELVRLLGPAQVATERIIAEWAKMGVPQTFVVGADGDLGTALLQSMPFTQARDMLLTMAGESGKQLGQAEGGKQLGQAEGGKQLGQAEGAKQQAFED